MVDSQLQVLAVVGSLNQNSVTHVVIQQIGDALREKGCRVDIFDPVREHLPLFNPDSSYSAAHYDPLQKRVTLADVLILGTPDYHGSRHAGLSRICEQHVKEFSGSLLDGVRREAFCDGGRVT
jgi:NAD(P)H-dependent FMN reductase